VLGRLPPYAVPAPVFRFPALAALAGRRPLGGEREVALAVFVCARLIVGMLPGSLFAPDARARRAAGARTWLAAVALPGPAKVPVGGLMDAIAQDDVDAVRAALRTLIEAIGRTLDPPSRRELERLGEDLGAGSAA
jgi:hypothetical protein